MSKFIKSEKEKQINLSWSINYYQTQADLQQHIYYIFAKNILSFPKPTLILRNKWSLKWLLQIGATLMLLEDYPSNRTPKLKDKEEIYQKKIKSNTFRHINKKLNNLRPNFNKINQKYLKSMVYILKYK